MTEYIEREAALEECDWYANEFCECEYAIMPLKGALKNLPAAEVRPVVRATWRRYSPFTDTYECSNCGEQVIDQQFRTNFCPNCGAMMEES